MPFLSGIATSCRYQESGKHRRVANTVVAEINPSIPAHGRHGKHQYRSTQIGERRESLCILGANSISSRSIRTLARIPDESAVHSRVAKPLVMGEFGWADGSGVDRPALTQTQMVKWLDQRACRGFLNWGYQAQSYDIGDGDNIHGIDRYAHGDYTALVTLYSNRASTWPRGARHARPPDTRRQETWPRPDGMEGGIVPTTPTTGGTKHSTRHRRGQQMDLEWRRAASLAGARSGARATGHRVFDSPGGSGGRAIRLRVQTIPNRIGFLARWSLVAGIRRR